MSQGCGSVERFVRYRCECCGRGAAEGELSYHKSTDEYWCDQCFDDEYDRKIEERDPSMPQE